MRALPLLLALLSAPVLAKSTVLLDAPKPIKPALEKALGAKVTVKGVSLSASPGAGEVKAACLETKASALVTARLAGGVYTVQVLNGADGDLLSSFKLKAPPGKRPVKAIPKGDVTQLVQAVAKGKVPSAEVEEKPAPKGEPEEKPVAKVEPKPKTEPKPEPEEAEEEPKPKTKTKRGEPPPKVEVAEAPEEPVEEATGDKPVALRAGAGLRMFSRRLFFVDNIFAQLSKYRLGLGPAIALDAEWFPGAHFTRGWGANFGIATSFDMAVGISSVAADGTRYGTSALRFRLGALARIPVGPMELRPTFGLGLQTFAIAAGASGTAKPTVPDVRYTNLRIGLGTRTKVIGPLSVLAGFAYDAPLAVGEIRTAYFPRLSVGGLDAHLGAAVGFGPVEVKLLGDYNRYWYSLKPEVGDKYVAGGALDDGFGIMLTVGFVL